MAMAISLAREFSSLKDTVTTSSGPRPPPRPPDWQSPPVNWLKINVDGDWVPDSIYAQASIIIHNHRGHTIFGHSFPIDASSARISKAKALFIGLTIAESQGWNSFILEGDASQLMNFLNNESKNIQWDVSTIMNDVKVMWYRFPRPIARAIPRSANGEAHTLAKRALFWCQNGTANACSRLNGSHPFDPGSRLLHHKLFSASFVRKVLCGYYSSDLLQLGFFKFQMHPLLFSSSSFLVLCIFFIIFHVFPLCLCDGDESDCTPEFDCGNITGIGYPFWGNGRPKYCGHPGFELLDCQKDYPTIQIMGLKYRVMEINPVNQILRIARIDFMEDICPLKFVNTALNYSLFDYPLGYEKLNLYYGCNFSLPQLPNRFTCSINGVPYKDAYVGSEVFLIEENEGTCNVSIAVPVLLTDKGLALIAANLFGILKKGFEVKWKVDTTPCRVCKDSGKRCGYDWISNQPTCFCPHQSYDSTCSTPRPTPVAAPAPISESESGTYPLLTLFIEVGLHILFARTLFDSLEFTCFCRDKPYAVACPTPTPGSPKLVDFALEDDSWVSSQLMGALCILLNRTTDETLSSADRQFEACAPRDCGNVLNISYPFWISDEQESYCGYPNFEITCKDSKPILTMSDDDSIIRDIFYKNQSFLVANEALNTTCPTPLNNFTLDRTPFNYSLNHADIFFFYNCTSVPDGEHLYKVPCASNSSHKSVAVFVHEGGVDYWNYTSWNCQSSVSTPIDVDEDGGFEKIIDLNFTYYLKEGFLLNWTAMNCSECEGSGGHCGFDNSEFMCFCKDQPHRRSCNDGTSYDRIRLVYLYEMGRICCSGLLRKNGLCCHCDVEMSPAAFIGHIRLAAIFRQYLHHIQEAATDERWCPFVVLNYSDG
ncbi:hypothetical protein HHK36_032443 [Tetracentron sinense]|uniref:Uncharacterized protein n=1 Tax=Tetracentron sinense TaxID=13715 RepID=A0A834Y842_TETSI|nr:hypothetical protein HHK36_032443 [Tetracentron sinense]